jgi:hypothetical protein
VSDPFTYLDPTFERQTSHHMLSPGNSPPPTVLADE